MEEAWGDDEYDNPEGPQQQPHEICIRLKSVSLLPNQYDDKEVALEVVVGDMRLWASPELKITEGEASWQGDDGKYPTYNFTLPPDDGPKPRKKLVLVFKLVLCPLYKKVVSKWKVDVLMFLGKIELLNTTIRKKEGHPQLVVNIIDVTALSEANSNAPKHLQFAFEARDARKLPSRRLKRRFSGRFIRRKEHLSKEIEVTNDEEADVGGGGGESTDEEGGEGEVEEEDKYRRGNGGMQFERERKHKKKKESRWATSESDEESTYLVDDVVASISSSASAFSSSLESSFRGNDSPGERGEKALRQSSFAPAMFSPDTEVVGLASHDIMYKVLILGNSGVGKTNLLSRWVYDSFSCSAAPTVQIDFLSKTFHINGKTICVQFWDTAGQERYRSLTRQYYKGAHGAVIMYSVSDLNSFVATSKWMTDLRNINEDAKILIAANKTDLERSVKVPTEDGVDYANSMNLPFIEVSAKNGTNCTKAMQLILQAIHLKIPQGTKDEEREEEEEEERKKAKMVDFSRYDDSQEEDYEDDCFGCGGDDNDDDDDGGHW
eukprot:TRINITY_DN1125_c0_g1_i1.p1 TRINITY_DN1125_c0_g1~~TRINITY_DN1125_c0_g1_i1.p1  ORF type:complete len:549 (-),score=126.36 TRINITY_DN1125_c0_g1_i1:154-1800(-)